MLHTGNCPLFILDISENYTTIRKRHCEICNHNAYPVIYLKTFIELIGRNYSALIGIEGADSGSINDKAIPKGYPL